MAAMATMGPVERVTNAMNILKTVRASDLKIERNVLYTPLYSGTALARKNSNTDDTYGTDEVVRKNIYYLAEQMKNGKQLLIQLIQRGFLNLSERENIVKYDDPFLMSVEMFSILIKKSASRYNLFLDILQETGNSEIADLLKNTILSENSGQNRGAGSGVSVTETPEKKTNPVKPPEVVIPIEPWFCRHCTFKNDSGRICAMCAKSSDSGQPTLPKSPRRGCPTCTFLNQPDSLECAICSGVL